MQCEEAGRLCGFDWTAATVDDRKLLASLTRWMTNGMVVGDGGYLSQAKAKELARRGVYLLTTTRKNMRHLASQFQLACLQLRHRVEEIFAFLKNVFGSSARPIAQHMPSRFTCWAVYSLIPSISP